MNPSPEPTRLLDPSSDAPGELRQLLSGGRDALSPTHEQLRALRAALAPIVGPPDGGDGGPEGGGAPGDAGGIETGAGSGAAGAAGTGGAAAGKGAAIAGAVGAKGGITKIAVVALLGASVGTAVVLETRGTRQLPTVAASPTPSATTTPPSERATSPVASSDAPPASLSVAAPASSAVAEPIERSAPARPAKPRPSVGSLGTAPSASTPPAAPESASAAPPRKTELELVSNARRVAASRPAEALALLDEHRQRFPSGMFEQEREVLAIETLTRMGRRDLARERAAAFAAKFPNSAHLRRIEVVLGGK